MTDKETDVTRRYADIIAYMSWMHASWKQPTVREIGEYMGWRSTSTTWMHLSKMQDAGLIESVPKQPRSMRVTKAGVAYAKEHGGKVHDNARQ